MTYPSLSLCPRCSRLRNPKQPCPHCQRRQVLRQRRMAQGLMLGCGVLALILLALVLSSCSGGPGGSDPALSMREKRATIMAESASGRSARSAPTATRAPGATGAAESDAKATGIETRIHVENAPLPPCEAAALSKWLQSGVTWPGRVGSGSRLPCQ